MVNYWSGFSWLKNAVYSKDTKKTYNWEEFYHVNITKDIKLTIGYLYQELPV
jgi:hypothetical protein